MKNLEVERKNTFDDFMTSFWEKFMEGESKYSSQQALYSCCLLLGEVPIDTIDWAWSFCHSLTAHKKHIMLNPIFDSCNCKTLIRKIMDCIFEATYCIYEAMYCWNRYTFMLFRIILTIHY